MILTDLIPEMFLTEAFALNHDALVDMIKNRRVVNIYYKGLKDDPAGPPGWRKIEPYAYGEDHGVKYLRAWLISGASATNQIPGWKFYRIDRIKNVNFASTKTFDKPRPLFNDKGDKHLSKIYALATFGKTPPEKPAGNNKPKPKPLVPSSGKTKDKPQADKNKQKTDNKKGTSLVKRLRTLKELFQM